MIAPKGMVADHWTWRGGRPLVTGWHRPVKRGKAEAEEAQPTGRGIVAAALGKSKRTKLEQGKLL